MSATIIGLLLASALGGGIYAMRLTAQVRRLRSEELELHRALQRAEIERTRLEAESARSFTLASELADARTRIEDLSSGSAALRANAERIPILEARVSTLTDEITKATAQNASLQSQMREQAVAQEDKLAVLTDVRTGLEKHLKTIATDVLQSNHGTFLKLANETFEKHKVAADADLQARQRAVEALVAPLNESLHSYQVHAEELERARSQAYGALSTELRGVAETQLAVRAETAKLVQALRAAPKTRGRWGEQTLRNVLELAGLSPYCDFSDEKTLEREENRLRPDTIIRLPGERYLVVDAKTSMSAYLDALDATDDLERERLLALHATQLRTHVKQLAAKAYWDGLTVTPDFVVMFVPGENFWAAAIERDPSLFEDAAAQRVVVATPSTLIALAKSVAFGWRQEKVAENAKRVHELGRELYRRMISMTEHIQNCGHGLRKSVQSFNQFVGSLEQSVMPQARRFNELEVEGTSVAIASLEPVEPAPRELRSDRDFSERLISANS